ncbi:hypothetical protein [Tessaracoccus lacteus]|uniref:Uncharacterized protein n=1 Tax=Tessaracoccus lacteus TaxID=3041766 RepID=A0ABY8PZZ7_9ACTN|nr:hypothetical protein [Tessaracoccus sp. T21]WGT48034.1 hypothetical protein QH948_04530 [Tessaracoccus sp. T21]
MASVDETQDWSRDPSLRSGRFDRLSDPTGSLSSSKGAERSEAKHPPPHAVLSGMASVDETQDWSRDPSLRSGRFDRPVLSPVEVLSDPTGSLSSSKGA